MLGKLAVSPLSWAMKLVTAGLGFRPPGVAAKMRRAGGVVVQS